MEIEEVEEVRRGRKEIGTTLINADIGEQRQEQYDRIIKGRYNPRYRELHIEGKPKYLSKEYEGRDQKLIARFGCGYEERGKQIVEKRRRERMQDVWGKQRNVGASSRKLQWYGQGQGKGCTNY